MIEIIPAIDIIDGKCVRLNQGDYAQKKVYNENPLEVARSFEDAGLRRLHLVDLDGAKASHIVNHKILESISTNTSLTIDFGGGLKSDEDLRIAFESGAAMVTGGSIAIKSPEVFQSCWKNTAANELFWVPMRTTGKLPFRAGRKPPMPTLLNLFPFGRKKESRRSSVQTLVGMACYRDQPLNCIAIFSANCRNCI